MAAAINYDVFFYQHTRMFIYVLQVVFRAFCLLILDMILLFNHRSTECAFNLTHLFQRQFSVYAQRAKCLKVVVGNNTRNLLNTSESACAKAS